LILFTLIPVSHVIVTQVSGSYGFTNARSGISVFSRPYENSLTGFALVAAGTPSHAKFHNGRLPDYYLPCLLTFRIRITIPA
jgi:hypothetical protein